MYILNRVPVVEESEALVDVVEDPGVGVDVERLDHVVESSQALIPEGYNSLSMAFQYIKVESLDTHGSNDRTRILALRNTNACLNSM